MRINDLVKDKLYNFFVRTNGRVWYEYERYVREHMEEHRLHRFRHLRVLLKLNWFYRVKKGNTPYLYWDVPLQPITNDSIMKETEKKGKQKSLIDSDIDNDQYIESILSQKRRMEPYHYAQSIMKHDVISFDMFDTLVVRKVDEPTDIFEIVGHKLGISNYRQIRINAEKKARQKSKAINGHEEISIYDIYKEVAFQTEIDANKGVLCEFETEMEHCIGNPYFLAIYNILMSNKKTICVTSDMYFNENQLKALLENCGYTNVDKIFVSCDYKCSKIRYGGELYKVIKKYYGEEKDIVHIGDNRKSDFENARLQNINARHYFACRTFGNKNKVKGLSPLISSFYNAVVNFRLHNGNEAYSLYWEFGYKYFGLLALGYVSWLHKMAYINDLDSVCFLARDGYLFKKIYDRLYTDIPSKYILWSRATACRYGLEKNYVISKLVKKGIGISTVRQLLDVIGLTDKQEIFDEYGFYSWIPIMRSNVESFSNVFLENWDRFNFEEKGLPYEKYLASILSECENIAIVDTGFSGRNLFELKKYLRSHIKDIKNIKMVYIANEEPLMNSLYNLKEEYKCYVFDTNENIAIKNKCTNNNDVFNALLERIYSWTGPSFCF